MRQSIILRKPLEQQHFYRRRCPGLGQTYSGRPVRGLAFLAAGLGLVATGGFHLDRAITYNDRSNRFTGAEGKGGFDDPYSDNFSDSQSRACQGTRVTLNLGCSFWQAELVFISGIFLDAAKTG